MLSLFIYMLMKLIKVYQLLLYISRRLEQKHTNTYCFKILLLTKLFPIKI